MPSGLSTFSLLTARRNGPSRPGLWRPAIGASTEGTVNLAESRSWSALWSVIAMSGCGGGRDGSGSSVAESPVSLPPSSGTPAPGTSGSARLMWFPPTTDEDGSPLNNLAGFRVYYGTSHLSLPRTSIDIANPSAITWTVGGLQPGTWCFAVTAVDANGHESSFSEILSKNIP